MSENNSRREFLQSAGLTAAAGVMAAAYPGAGVSLEAAAAPASAKTMGARFRELLQKREPFAAVAAYDVFAARMVEEMGFQALFMGGSLTGDFYAQPVWLNDLSERLAYVRHIAEHVDIPTLVDFDDGGDPMRVYRYTKEFERAHIGAVHILDDLVGPMGVAVGVIPVDKMVDKIHAAVDARSDVAVTVRCGAAAPNREGTDKAIERGVAYAEAGAETIWFTGMMLEDMPRVADAIKIPVTAQFRASTPFMSAKDLKVTCVVYASLLQNISQSAVYDALMELKTTGQMVKAAGNQALGGHIPLEFRQKVTRVADIAERGKKYNVTP